MMAFLSGAMSSATQRFLTFELGKGDLKSFTNVFKMSANIQIIIILFVILIAETLGVWFINTQLVISPGRLAAANVVFHCSLLSFCFTIISVPYIATIIAYEKMSAFAYVSIIDVLLKLVAAFILVHYGEDKLEFHAMLVTAISIVVFFCYYLYARWQFNLTRLSFYWDVKLFKVLFGYMGWNLFGNLAFVMSSQGVNIILNVFFGAYVNAARAIAIQVNSAINGFVISLQTAINPQLTKAYASNDLSYMHDLVFSGAKYSFYLLLALSLPVLVETEGILNLWLDAVPQYTSLFVKLVLIELFITCLSGTLMTSAQATGNIKLYQSVIGGLQLLNIPLSFMFLTLTSEPLCVFYVSIVISIISLFVRLIFMRSMICLSMKKFIKVVLFPSAQVVVCAALSSYCIDLLFNVNYFDAKKMLVVKVVILYLAVICTIYFVGLTQNERRFIIKNALKKKTSDR